MRGLSKRPPRMTEPEVTLFRHAPGSVVAPAGCGKTQTIVDALATYDGPPVLVLTHTNAGVTALRLRLNRAAVPPARYRLATIDGWALKIISLYPRLAGHRNDGGAVDYPATQEATVAMIESGVLSPVLRATYGRLVVDEYQDCSARQHRLIRALAAELPCHVLGDPLQCVFNFNGAHPDWMADVLPIFPTVLELDVPHRWMNAGEEAFGRWVLECREPLLRGASIDLAGAPANVRWLELPAAVADRGPARSAAALAAAAGLPVGEKLMIIGDSQPVSTRLDFARATAGVQVVEPVDLKDMIEAATSIDGAVKVERLNAVIRFVRDTMAEVAGPLVARLNALRRGEAENPTDVERAALRIADQGSLLDVRDMLNGLQAGRPHIYRPHLLATMIASLTKAIARGIPLLQAAIAERELQRTKGRALPRLGIGSTLLLKGLESEHAFVLNADAMTAQHLYVALSRASISLTIMSRERQLP